MKLLLETHDADLSGAEGSYRGTVGRRGELLSLESAEEQVRGLRDPLHRAFLLRDGVLVAVWAICPREGPAFVGHSPDYSERLQVPYRYGGFTRIRSVRVRPEADFLKLGLLLAVKTFVDSVTACVAVTDDEGVLAAWERSLSGPRIVARSPRPLPAPLGSSHR